MAEPLRESVAAVGDDGFLSPTEEELVVLRAFEEADGATPCSEPDPGGLHLRLLKLRLRLLQFLVTMNQPLGYWWDIGLYEKGAWAFGEALVDAINTMPRTWGKALALKIDRDGKWRTNKEIAVVLGQTGKYPEEMVRRRVEKALEWAAGVISASVMIAACSAQDAYLRDEKARRRESRQREKWITHVDLSPATARVKGFGRTLEEQWAEEGEPANDAEIARRIAQMIVADRRPTEINALLPWGNEEDERSPWVGTPQGKLGAQAFFDYLRTLPEEDRPPMSATVERRGRIMEAVNVILRERWEAQPDLMRKAERHRARFQARRLAEARSIGRRLNGEAVLAVRADSADLQQFLVAFIPEVEAHSAWGGAAENEKSLPPLASPEEYIPLLIDAWRGIKPGTGIRARTTFADRREYAWKVLWNARRPREAEVEGSLDDPEQDFSEIKWKVGVDFRLENL
jgi:hypothetical protein